MSIAYGVAAREGRRGQDGRLTANPEHRWRIGNRSQPRRVLVAAERDGENATFGGACELVFGFSRNAAQLVVGG
jgi:hypothetical protein